MHRTIRKLIRRAVSPYRAVIIDQDGDRFEHRAMTTRDARDWIACYGAGVGIVYTRSGRIAAVRIA
jgi:hypothetical protein